MLWVSRISTGRGHLAYMFMGPKMDFQLAWFLVLWVMTFQVFSQIDFKTPENVHNVPDFDILPNFPPALLLINFNVYPWFIFPLREIGNFCSPFRGASVLIESVYKMNLKKISSLLNIECVMLFFPHSDCLFLGFYSFCPLPKLLVFVEL